MDINLLKSIGKIKTYHVNEFVFCEGVYEKTMYIVIRGMVQIFVDVYGITPIEVATLGSGSFFGEMEIINDCPRLASAFCLEENTMLLELTDDNFEVLLEKQSDLIYTILFTLIERVKGSIDKLPEESPLLLQDEPDKYYLLESAHNQELIKKVIEEKQYDLMTVLRYYSNLLEEVDMELIKYNRLDPRLIIR